LGLDAEEIAGDEPDRHDNAYGYYQSRREDLDIQTGAFFPLCLNPNKEHNKRERNESKRISPKCTHQIAMKQRMRHSLASTPYALQTGDFIEHALRHKSTLKRVEYKIKEGNRHQSAQY
jgi:hypothetical protein